MEDQLLYNSDFNRNLSTVSADSLRSGDVKKAGRFSIQIDTIQDRGITDVYSRILRHVTDSVENI